MPLIRPKLSRTTSAPSAPVGAVTPVRDQTLRTLQMLKNMGYNEVWCKGDEVDESIIDRAALEGWRICDVRDGRIKFTLRPSTPAQEGPRQVRRGSQGRTQSPTDAAPPMPSPLAAHRRASEADVTPPEERQRRHEALLAWDRRPSAIPMTPNVLVSPPAEEEITFTGDYFTFVPVAPGELDEYVPPVNSWMDRRQQQHQQRPPQPLQRRSAHRRQESLRSQASAYSLPSVEESEFEFDEEEPFAGAQPSRPQATLSPLLGSTRRTFRPQTPELRIPVAPRARAGSEQLQIAPPERPTFRLNRLASDPGHNADPGFELLPVLPPRWRCRDT